MHFGPLCIQLSVQVSFFNLWEGQKWGLFPKDRTYRAFLHNKLLFSDSPEGLNAFWTFVYTAESAS